MLSENKFNHSNAVNNKKEIKKETYRELICWNRSMFADPREQLPPLEIAFVASPYASCTKVKK